MGSPRKDRSTQEYCEEVLSPQIARIKLNEIAGLENGGEGKNDPTPIDDEMKLALKKKAYPNSVIEQYAKPGDNRTYLLSSMELANLGPVDWADPDEVRYRINEFFMIQAKYDLKPTVAGMALALGVDRRRLSDIKNGNVNAAGLKHISSESMQIVQNAYMTMENMWEYYMINGKVNPASGIFLGKNNFGYRDVIENVVTPNLQKEVDEDSIRERY